MSESSESPDYIESVKRPLQDSLPPSLAWLVDETIEPPSDTPEFMDGVLFSEKQPISEDKRQQICLSLYNQLMRIKAFSDCGDREKMELERQKYLKHIRILERSYGYLSKINNSYISGNPLRVTQKIAAFGFRDFIQDNLFKEKLMGHIVQPVGAGKTNVAVMLSEMSGGRTVFIAHNNGDNIIKSFSDHQKSVHPVSRKSVGQCFGNKMETESDIMVAHFASAHKWLSSINWSSVDLIVVDEADINALTENRRQILEELSSKYGIPVIGMSATEDQASGKQLQDAFPSEICRLGMPDGLQKCLQLGITSQMKFYDLHLDLEMMVDKEEIKRLADLPDESVDEFIRSNNWIELILQDYLSKYKEGDKLKPSILVLRDNLLVSACLEKAKKNGIRAVAYTGDLSPEERDQRRKDLVEGKIDMLVGSKLVGRGLHIPEVEVVYNSTITWSPQVFWQADGRGASIDKNNPDKISHVIAVLPRTMNDKMSGFPLPPELKPFSHSTFFDPFYFEGREERLLDFDNKSSVFKRRTAMPDRRACYEYDLRNVEAIRSIREVHDLIKRLKSKPDGFINRGRVIARYIDSLGEDTPLTMGLARHIINMISADIKGEAEDFERFKIKHQSYVDTEKDPEENQDTDIPESVRYIEELCKNAPMLTSAEEKSLLERIKSGDREAEKIIIHSYLPLILSVAKKMHVSGFDLSDFVNQGIEGVMGLFKTPNKIRGGLSGYILVICFSKMHAMVLDESRDVDLPRHVFENFSKISNTRDAINKKLSLADPPITRKYVSDDEVLDELVLTPDAIVDFKKERRFPQLKRRLEIYNKVNEYLRINNSYLCLKRPGMYGWNIGYGDKQIPIEKVASYVGASSNEILEAFSMGHKERNRVAKLVNTHSKLKNLEVVRDLLFQDYQDDKRPTFKWVAQMLGKSPERAQEIFEAYPMREVSLQESEISSPVEAPNSHECVEASELVEAVRKALETLSPREKEALLKKYFEDNEMKEIAENFATCRQRTWQILKKALRKLRHSSQSKFLEDFYY